MDLEKKAFERLKLGAETSEHLYNAPLIICYSGGKDNVPSRNRRTRAKG